MKIVIMQSVTEAFFISYILPALLHVISLTDLS